jgi:4-aminobutyrate aminotransferase
MSKRTIERGLDLVKRDAAVIGRAMQVRVYPFVPAQAKGTRLWDADGNEYLDWMGIAGVASVGYGHPHVRAAIDAALDGEYAHVFAQYVHEPGVRLAERLVELMPGDFKKKVWFGLSGSDAMDCAAKLLPLRERRPRLISFMGGFAGLTIGSAAISGHAMQAKTIGGGHVAKAPYPYPYRCPWGPCDPEECSLKCLQFLEEQVMGFVSPPEDTAAVILEAIQSDNGEVVPPENYLPALRDLCDRHGIWLAFDEVKTGLGRTGRMFAFEHSGIVADAVGLGKPLGGGMPISAVVARAEMLDVDVVTAFTLGGSPVSCNAALATLEVIETEKLVENAERVGAYLRRGLGELAKKSGLIGDVRGRGLMIGVELVSNQGTRAPAPDAAAQLANRCFEDGLLLVNCGSLGNVLEITPPLTITEEEADRALEIFEGALASVEREHLSSQS